MANPQTIRRAGTAAAHIDEGLRAHMNRVYGIMGLGMAITGAVAYYVGNNDALIASLFTGASRYVIMFAPLVFVFFLGGMINRVSENTARLLFMAFSALMGLSIAWIFAVYTGISITQTFFTTAIAFAGLSLYGYTTKKDISGWGTFLIMGVIGLIVAAIINIFIESSALSFAISAIGLLIFAGLTAYDTQNIKNTYLAMANAGQDEWLNKAAIMGALNLYLNFLNMFMFLLHFMGGQE
ncbi:membrane protein [Amylibacter marinus]|uniref:Membrane protein n=1 Tax=Amylibacter marinus TaxID=1475483 RepID=A0ABQ5VTD9_9RHOB|nr:Bax inhibitor-1/YccA family protein [Amylibacter marinus]GLQ34541.1 membrane protein [Amylibacter marinus]